MMSRGLTSERAREVLDKFPTISSRAAARLLARELGVSENAGRNAVRAVRGIMPGKSNKIRPTHKATVSRGYLPKGVKSNYAPVALEHGMWGIVGDLHVPFHHEESLELAVKEIRKRGARKLLINGDFADCHAVSRYAADPRKRDFPAEVRACKDVLEWLRGKFDRIVWKLGNHEERYEHFMWANCPVFLGLERFSFEGVFDAGDIEIVRDKRPVMLGKLAVLHGHEYRFAISNPVNPARGLFLRARTSSVCNHFHQASHHGSKRLGGEAISCWSLGCLCDLNPDYMPLNEWVHGAAVCDVDGEGNFEMQAFKIINGRVYPA